MEEVLKPKESLAALEDALKQAHLTVTTECDISELVCQSQRAQQLIGLAHAEALDLVATLEQDNEAQLEKARKMVVDLESKVTTLKAILKALQPAVLAFDAVTAVYDFIELYKTAYQNHLADLFSFLGWRYMETALLSSGLSKVFLHVITANHPEMDTRDWQVVTKAVKQVISIHTMRHQVKVLHFQPKIER
ncbi:hypothetical protein BGX29_002849, partial [Mortierella sp. GBA35]